MDAQEVKSKEKQAAGQGPGKNEIPGMFEGPILKPLIRLAFPIYAGMLFQLLYSITDTIWVSRIDLNDPSYVGATGIVFPILFLAMAIHTGLLIGVSSLVARAIGERNREILGKTAESGLVIALGLSVLFLFSGYVWAEELLGLLGARGDYYLHALEYLYYIVPAAALIFVASVFNGILQGEGLMKHVMWSMIIGTVSNIILDPIFIFLLNMKVRGAALATSIAELLAVIYVVGVFLKKKSQVGIQWRISNVNAKTMGRIAAVGFPQAMGHILLSMSFLVFNRIVVSIDELAFTAFTICGRFDQTLFMPVFAIGSALITMIGQNVGRGNFQRVERIWRIGVIAALALVLLLAAVLVLLAPLIYPFFSDLAEVIRYAVLQTRIMEFSFLFIALVVLARSVFQAIGRPLPALLITLLRVLLLAFPMVYLFVYVLDLGMYGVWFGLIAANALAAAISVIWVNHLLRRLKQDRIEIPAG